MTPRYHEPKYVYGLVDPRDGRVRYVGGSGDPLKRFKNHLDRVGPPNDDLAAWLDELDGEGLRPDLRLFTGAPIRGWAKLEREVQDEHGATLLDHHGRGRAITREYTKKEIGGALKNARRAAGLSTSEAAAALHTTNVTVSRWESGARAPRIGQLLSISRAYGVPVPQLLPMPNSKGAAADAALARKGSQDGKQGDE